MIFHWSLSDSKSPQISRTILRILTDLNNAIVYMVSHSPLIFKSSNSFTKPLGTVVSPSFSYPLDFFSPLVHISFFAFFSSYSVVCWDGKVHCPVGSLFFWLSLGLVVWPSLYICGIISYDYIFLSRFALLEDVLINVY